MNDDPVSFFARVEFPSDAISVKRLRRTFPDRFDNGRLNDGFGTFFNPECCDPAGKPDDHLWGLDALISAERTLAAYAIYDTFDPYPSATLDEECRESYDIARTTLEDGYQRFKLADSPATARLLVQNVENAGRRIAEQARDRPR